MQNHPIDERTARLYDLTVPGWPGEIDFYEQLIGEIDKAGKSVLEIGCGTGRVSIRLAHDDTHVVGMDVSAAMLEIARNKSAGMSNIQWLQADMNSFDLGQSFDLVIVPGHSFQFMLTPEDQLACLAAIKRHLFPDGRVVLHIDHQDIAWLGRLRTDQGGAFEPAGEVLNPVTGRRVRTYKAWSYEPATQTASCLIRREEIGEDGQVLERWETGPVHLHCIFRFEMEHLLKRSGFMVVALFGDFHKNELTGRSTDMIWVGRPEMYAPDRQT